MGLSNEIILVRSTFNGIIYKMPYQGIIAFSIVLLQIPFAFLIISMHQMFMTDSSPFKLSKRQVGLVNNYFFQITE